MITFLPKSSKDWRAPVVTNVIGVEIGAAAFEIGVPVFEIGAAKLVFVVMKFENGATAFVFYGGIFENYGM